MAQQTTEEDSVRDGTNLNYADVLEEIENPSLELERALETDMLVVPGDQGVYHVTLRYGDTYAVGAAGEALHCPCNRNSSQSLPSQCEHTERVRWMVEHTTLPALEESKAEYREEINRKIASLRREVQELQERASNLYQLTAETKV